MHADRKPSFLSLPRSALLRYLAVAFICTFASWVGGELGRSAADTYVIWPVNGLLLGIALLSSRKWWLGYLLSAGVVSLLLHVRFHSPLFSPGRLIVFSVANVAEVLVATVLLRHQDEGRPYLLDLRMLLKFILCGAFVAPLVSTTVIAIGELLLHQPHYSTIHGLRDWFIGNALGITVSTPIVLAIQPGEVLRLLRPEKRIETLVLLIMLTALSGLVFRQTNSPVAVILFPILILITFRLGTSGAVIGVILLAIPASFFAVMGRGPFPLAFRGALIINILYLQLFLSILTLTVCVVGATFAEGRRLHDALVDSYKRLAAHEASQRNLNAALMRAQDQERRRIARELHDGVSQAHAIIALNLGKIQVEAFSENNKATIAKCRKLTEEASRELRAICYLLHPPLLEELGFESALKIYTDGFMQRTGIVVHVEMEADLAKLGSELEWTLFRVVQESLSNILRHSGSATAQIRLQIHKDILLEIEDHGRGFPTESLSDIDGNYRLGVGIAGMRERIRQLGGTLQLLSSDNRGAIVRVIIPNAGSGAL
jgi:signal transduction histidine kinase